MHMPSINLRRRGGQIEKRKFLKKRMKVAIARKIIDTRLRSVVCDAMMQVKAPAALLAIAILAVGLRITFFSGFINYDDRQYIERAVELSRGAMTPPDSHWAARLGVVVPAALFYRAFGVAPAATVAWPFLCSLLGVCAAFFLGRRLYDAPTGVVAALLMALFPLDILFATILYPTEPVILLAGAGLVGFVIAERERKPLLYLASGAAVGAAALAHEASVMALAFYPLYVVFVRRPSRGHLIAGAGFVFGLALDPLMHGLMGDPWAHVSVTSHTRAFEGTEAAMAYSGFNAAWITEPIVRTFVERMFGLYTWLLAPVVALRLWKPRAADDRVLAIMVAAGYLWIVYGTTSPFGYVPLWRLPRYVAPLVLPALLLLAHELAHGLGRGARAAVLSLLAVSSIGCLMLDSGNMLTPYRELQSVLARERPAKVVVEHWHRIGLLYAEGFAPRYAVSELGDARPSHAVVVAANAALRAEIEALPGTVLLARITPPETLYLRLLRNPWVMAFLRLTRPASRLSEYARRSAPWELRVYRVP
jgi:4-amino-4-deoxy-L-arabinose transferase-like glycosyltransferase